MPLKLKKIKFSIDKLVFSRTFTTQNKKMNLTGAYYFGYYFYFNSKSRD